MTFRTSTFSSSLNSAFIVVGVALVASLAFLLPEPPPGYGAFEIGAILCIGLALATGGALDLATPTVLNHEGIRGWPPTGSLNWRRCFIPWSSVRSVGVMGVRGEITEIIIAGEANHISVRVLDLNADAHTVARFIAERALPGSWSESFRIVAGSPQNPPLEADRTP